MAETIKTEEQKATALVLTHKIHSLGLTADFVDDISTGPIVTIYRFIPKGSTKVSQLEALSKDFAVALASPEEILVKRMPGEVAVCVFVPNHKREEVKWRDLCYLQPNGVDLNVPILLGIDLRGKRVVDDLYWMPHLLVAGSTGGGKSTWMNSVIATLMVNRSPEQVQLILIDLKRVEFNHFRDSPHLLFPPCLTTSSAHQSLDWTINEMEGRLARFEKSGDRNIIEFNNKAVKNQTAPLAFIVIIIDEIASLLCNEEKQDEEDRGPSLGKIASRKLSQLAEKARATGIHIIAATQRPSVKVVEGNIKANFPARLSFKLVSQTDSRVILDTTGAESLLNRGDMLFLNPNKPGLTRIHAPIASLEDIKAAVEFAKQRR